MLLIPTYTQSDTSSNIDRGIIWMHLGHTFTHYLRSGHKIYQRPKLSGVLKASDWLTRTPKTNQ